MHGPPLNSTGEEAMLTFAVEMACRFDAVIHFAAFKAVGESMEKPLEYYHNNIGGSMSLLQSMRAANVKV
jgi:UDP-glucose 4-epimerase